MRGKLRWGALFSLVCAAVFASAAHADLSKWSSLSGLTASDKASWVRVYQTGSPPTTIYAGTEGNGVYKSVDDGLTWSAANTGMAHTAVRTIYTSGGKVFAGTDSGLFSAPDTTSPGASWTKVAQGPETNPQHPTKLNQAVQAVISLTAGPMLAGTASEGVFRSTDDGQTWQPPPADDGMAAGTTVWSFASFANFVWAATSDGIYRSSDQGSTWTLSSDGIPDTAVTLGIFQDTQNPLIYYAETGSDGVYRSVDGGTTWQDVNGDDSSEPFGGSSTPQVHAMVEFSGATQTRLYTATSDGLWVGTLPNQTVPGPQGKVEVPGDIAWRQVTQAGLGNNTIMWALSSFTTVPGTLLAGTQSNGGYSLTFQPPVNKVAPAWFGSLHVGVALVGTPGSWDGTETIDYDYQWQRCSTSSSGTCADIDGADHKDYTLAAADQGKYIRLKVTASNDFPTGGKDTAFSAVQGPVAQKLGKLPGDDQTSAPAIEVTPADDQFLPTEGDTLTAPPQSAAWPAGWLFKPSADVAFYQWLRCDENGDNCVDIPNATDASYVLQPADDADTIEVDVTGENAFGETTLRSGPTNQIIPAPAKDITPPTLLGDAYVGSSLVGGVGTWVSPNTYWTRQWEQCEPDGSDCSPIQGATSPSYTVTANDLGMRLRMHVVADVNPSFQLPDAVDAYTPLSAVVTNPPGTPPPAPPVKPTGPGGGSTHVPAISGLKLTGGTITLALSGPGRVVLTLEHAVTGHRVHGRCVSGKRKHKKACTTYKTVLTFGQTSSGGPVSVPLPAKLHGHSLPAGRYRVIVTPFAAGGQAGTAQTLNLVLKHHSKHKKKRHRHH
jgi:photosystem II stability/assembly factor-like uncharacterized protein